MQRLNDADEVSMIARDSILYSIIFVDIETSNKVLAIPSGVSRLDRTSERTVLFSLPTSPPHIVDSLLYSTARDRHVGTWKYQHGATALLL